MSAADDVKMPVTFGDMIAWCLWKGPTSGISSYQWWNDRLVEKRAAQCANADGAGVTKSATTQDVTGSASARPSAYGVNDVASPSAPNSGPSAGGTGSGAISVADAVEKLRAAINDDRLFRNGSVTSDYWDAVQRIEIAVRTLLWLDVPAVLKAANDRADSLADSMIYEKRRADLYWGDTNSLRADLNAAHTECDSLRARLSEAVGLLADIDHGASTPFHFGMRKGIDKDVKAFLAREKEKTCQNRNGASAGTSATIIASDGAPKEASRPASDASRTTSPDATTPSAPPPPPAPAGTGATDAKAGGTERSDGRVSTSAERSKPSVTPSAPIRGEPSVVTAAREQAEGRMSWVREWARANAPTKSDRDQFGWSNDTVRKLISAYDAIAERLRVEREEADMMAVIVNADSDDNVCGVCGGTGPNQANAFLVRQWKRRYRARRAGEGRK